MKTMEFFALSTLLSMAAYGGIADALSASGPLPVKTPLSPSSAATPPKLNMPGGGTVPDAPAGSPRHPKSTPMPAPASTNHYAHHHANHYPSPAANSSDY